MNGVAPLFGHRLPCFLDPKTRPSARETNARQQRGFGEHREVPTSV